MDVLVQLHDAKRQAQRWNDENMYLLAIEEIELLRELRRIYESLYTPLPKELISLIEMKISAKQANNALIFNKTNREIVQYLENYVKELE